MFSIPFDGGLILVNRRRDKLFFYNGEAAELWWQVADSSLQGRDLSTQQAAGNEDFITALYAHWRSDGLLPHEGEAVHLNEPAYVPPTFTGDPAEWAAQWTCQIHGRVFDFRVEHRRDAAILRHLLAHMETEAPGDRLISVRRDAERSLVFLDGVFRLHADSLTELKTGVHQIILDHIYPSTRWLTIIHAAAMAKDGRSIVLAAASGSGKTTLSAYLARRGFAFLSDDIAPIRSPDAKVVAWPIPASVKEGSWEVLALDYPQLNDQPSFRTKGMAAKLLFHDPSSWDIEPQPVHALLFPRYDAEMETQIVRIRPSEALQLLIAAGLWIGHPLTKSGVEAFLAWLNKVPCFAVIYRSLASAHAALARDVFDQA